MEAELQTIQSYLRSSIAFTFFDPKTKGFHIVALKNMAVIDSVKLVAKHEQKWRFSDRSRTLSGGSIVLTVKDGATSWQFQCRSDGDKHCIYGNEWCRFVGARIKAGKTSLALYKEDNEDVYRIK